MAGRNWTRKSIEELIDEYLRTKGGSPHPGGELSGYCELALSYSGFVPTIHSYDHISLVGVTYPQMFVIKYQNLHNGLLKSVGGVKLTCVEILTPTSLSEIKNDYIIVRQLPYAGSTDKYTGTLTYIQGKYFCSNKDLAYYSPIKYVYILIGNTSGSNAKINFINRYTVTNDNMYPKLLHRQDSSQTYGYRYGRHYIDSNVAANTKFLTVVENKLNEGYNRVTWAVLSTTELTISEIYDNFHTMFGYIDSSDTIGYSEYDITNDINNL